VTSLAKGDNPVVKEKEKPTKGGENSKKKR